MKNIIIAMPLLFSVAFAQLPNANNHFEGIDTEAVSMFNSVLDEMNIILLECPEGLLEDFDNPSFCGKYALEENYEIFAQAWSLYVRRYGEGWTPFTPWESEVAVDVTYMSRVYFNEEAERGFMVTYIQGGIIMVNYLNLE